MLSTLFLLAAVPVVPAGEVFTCTPVSVWDGDGPVWCAEGPHVRLAGIAAREMDGSCRSNQPCPDATAALARDALVRLIGVPTGRSMEGHVLLKGPLCGAPQSATALGIGLRLGVYLRWAVMYPVPWSEEAGRCAGIATGGGIWASGDPTSKTVHSRP